MFMDTQQQKLYKKLKTPALVQDFLNTLPANFEIKGETCRSPKQVLSHNTAHCLEGAMLAASILRFHGHKPLLMDLRARRPDDDHVVTLFRQGKCWGAISKSNHAVLRYREPVYRSLRELAMSYFHEYFDNATGKKNLREYSYPFDLSRYDHLNWETADKDLWEIPEALDGSRHISLVSGAAAKHFRKADPIEIRAGSITEWSRDGRRVAAH